MSDGLPISLDSGPDPEDATDCDECHAGIAYGETCYAVPTGTTWDVPDQDEGNPIVRVLCAACYTGPARVDVPTTAILQRAEEWKPAP